MSKPVNQVKIEVDPKFPKWLYPIIKLITGKVISFSYTKRNGTKMCCKCIIDSYKYIGYSRSVYFRRIRDLIFLRMIRIHGKIK